MVLTILRNRYARIPKNDTDVRLVLNVFVHMICDFEFETYRNMQTRMLKPIMTEMSYDMHMYQ